jgi:hypothetical protein
VAVLLFDAWRRGVDASVAAQHPGPHAAGPHADGLITVDLRPIEDQLTDAVSDSAQEFSRQALTPDRRLLPWPPEANMPVGPDLAAGLISRLKLNTENVQAADQRCSQALQKLEREGLLVDPWFMPLPSEFPQEAVLLFGLIPMQWSVRTNAGERVYREIRIDAPLWSLSIDRVREGRRKPFTNWSLNIRGVSFIRSLLRRAALAYLGIEEQTRREESRSMLPPPADLDLDAPDEEDKKQE